jgi:hypothetical protein
MDIIWGRRVGAPLGENGSDSTHGLMGKGGGGGGGGEEKSGEGLKVEFERDY